VKTVEYKFVERIPNDIPEGILFISIEFETAIHKCCCGCGKEVVTPISPTGWKLIYNGESVSLYPSIGNWSFDCKSHYWIRENRVLWADKWSSSEIEEVRKNEKLEREKYYKKKNKKHRNWKKWKFF